MPNLADLNGDRFETLLGALAADKPVAVRSAAADAVAKATLSRAQLRRLCEAIPSVGPLELDRLIAPFAKSTEEAIGLELLSALSESPALVSLRFDLLREHLAKYGPAVQARIAEVESQVNQNAAAQRKHLEELAPLVAQGDVRRGHAVFYSSKAACSACHKLGAAGGTTGPELTRVGEARTERDLLESILFPSMSFVRGYEPVQILTVDGETINGVVRDETADEYILATGADQEVRVARDAVEQMDPGTVSIMPAGLEQQLSQQELADLVAFLKNVSGN
jgi:putative heme-binding domain-containing protein